MLRGRAGHDLVGGERRYGWACVAAVAAEGEKERFFLGENVEAGEACVKAGPGN
jgi:hypothetical protein